MSYSYITGTRGTLIHIMNHNVCSTAIDVAAMLYFEHAYSLFFGIPNTLIRIVDMMLGGILMIFN